MNKQSDGHRRNGLSQVLALNEKGRSFGGGGGGGGGGGCGTRALVTLGLTTGHTPMKNVNFSICFSETETTDITASTIDTQRFICRQVG